MDFKFACIHLIGGLLPHTLNATLFADGSPACFVLNMHMVLGATFATIGHGLDVLIALGGNHGRGELAGWMAAVFPKQEHLLEINSIRKSPECICSYSNDAVKLVSAS